MLSPPCAVECLLMRNKGLDPMRSTAGPRTMQTPMPHMRLRVMWRARKSISKHAHTLPCASPGATLGAQASSNRGSSHPTAPLSWTRTRIHRRTLFSSHATSSTAPSLVSRPQDSAGLKGTRTDTLMHEGCVSRLTITSAEERVREDCQLSWIFDFQVKG